MPILLLPGLLLPHPQEIHIWQLYLPDFQHERLRWWDWLSRDERDRAQRFYRTEDRDRFVLSRGGLRYLLARYLDCEPGILTFTYGAYGKPSLLSPAKALNFNLAHSGKWVVYAVGDPLLLGIDVEQANPRTHLDGLIQRCLTPEEQHHLPMALPERLEGFLEYWTVKEAHLKAVGLGLSYPMTQVEVAWQPQPRLVRPAQGETIPHSAWTVTLWCPGKGAIAAACVGQADTQFSIRPFPAEKVQGASSS